MTFKAKKLRLQTCNLLKNEVFFVKVDKNVRFFELDIIISGGIIGRRLEEEELQRYLLHPLTKVNVWASPIPEKELLHD